jgi:hypothetical protein
MPEKLPIYHDIPAHRYSVALDGVQYRVRFIYRERTASWYLDLWDQDGTLLLAGRRLSPNWSPQARITGGPPGLLVAFGPDPYARDDVELWYFTAAELAAAKPAAAALLPVELT